MTTFYEIFIALTTVFLLSALGWSVSLRRRVREQTQVIREQVEREAELEADYRGLFEHANDLIYRHDLTGVFTSLNRAAEHSFGFVKEEGIGLAFRDFVVPEQRSGFDQWLGTCISGHAPLRTELTLLSRD